MAAIAKAVMQFMSLPHEIIEQIFAECLPVSSTIFLPPLHPESAPLLLMHVCSFWRRIALNFSPLWRSFSLECREGNWGVADVDMGDSELYEQTLWHRFLEVRSRMLEQVALWHAASKGLHVALSVTLHSPFFSRQGERLTWPKVLRAAVLDHVHIIHKLKLSIPREDAQILCNIPPSDMYNLECLELQFHLNSGSDVSRVLSSVLQVPQLRQLQLAQDILIPHSFSSSRLTHLSLLAAFPGAIFRHIIQEFPLLERLSMIVSEDTPPLKGSITAYHLTTLSLTFEDCHNSSFFRDLYFPTLNHLHLLSSLGLGNYLFSWDDGDVVHYQHFVRQLHHLQTLILGYTQIKGDALLDILRSTPELVNLVVDSCMVTYKSFLAGLTYNPDYEYHSILPKLESFTMYIDSEDARFYESFEEEMVGLIEVLLKMIHSRTRPLSMDDSYPGNGPARLRKVLLCHDDDSAFTTHFKLPLQASQDLCGLDFTILEDSAKEDWATEKEWFW